METIIHIGQHKTATTSIQKYLLNNKLKLKEQKIYFTDKILDYQKPNHIILNVYALLKDRKSGAKRRVIESRGIEYLNELDKSLPAEIERIYSNAVQENCDKIIWSNEGLYLLNSEIEYEKLLNLFKPFSSKVTIVCCFRDKKSYIKSYEKMMGGIPSDDPESHRYTKKDSWLLDYDGKKNLLSKVFDEVLCFDYNPKDNIKEFLKVLKIENESNTQLRLNVTKKKKKESLFLRIMKRLKK